MEKLVSPPRPELDFNFRYNDAASPGNLLDHIAALPEDIFVYLKQPWFPYLAVQWKSAQGTIRKGEQQARRDASAAVDTIHRFLKRPNSEPSPVETCIFS